ncbi:MAG: flavocytochrome C [Betaproteobacteria bacterium]|nr:flavocytochrome C [Betaproteobacteria bacterium]
MTYSNLHDDLRPEQTGQGRRRFTQSLGLAGVAGLVAGCATMGDSASSKKLGRVAIVGAGYGGATAARYLKVWGGESVDVVLYDRAPQFISCPMSNLVIGGSLKLADLTVSYQGLKDSGVLVLQDEVTGLDAAKRRLSFVKFQDQSFDRIIVSPGVDFMFDQIQGFNPEAQKTVMHAWKAGEQTVTLRQQLEAMPDGGVVVMSIPLAPYRCPPGPYERICQMAHYLKAAKPKSKIIVLDANPEIVSKKGLFTKAFDGPYKGFVEYRPNSRVTELDAASRTVMTELGDRVKGNVLNVIPPQRAGDLVVKAGLANANNRWANVDWLTMESTAAKGIHVLGDASFSAPTMPKSGHMANQHGKTAAAAILDLMAGREPRPSTMANTCYSFVNDRDVVHVASVHQYDAAQKTMLPVKGAGGLSTEPNALEGSYANAWAQNIWRDMFSKIA